MLGSRTWQLRLEGAVPRVSRLLTNPGSFREMTPENIPGRYRKALLEAVAALGVTRLWGVALPERTRTAMRHRPWRLTGPARS